VKRALLRMRAQSLKLREHMGYCSPLGTVLRAIRATRADSKRGRIGIRSIRRLEEAGIRSIEDLAPIEVDGLVRLGIRQDLAERIRAYISEVGQRSPKS
jgi:helicase